MAHYSSHSAQKVKMNEEQIVCSVFEIMCNVLTCELSVFISINGIHVREKFTLANNERNQL